jgi:hypothetical protein
VTVTNSHQPLLSPPLISANYRHSYTTTTTTTYWPSPTMTTVAQKPVSDAMPETGKNGSATNHRSKYSKSHGSSGHGQRQHRRLIGSFQLGKTLGAGSMGKVKLAQHVVTGKKVSERSVCFFYVCRHVCLCIYLYACVCVFMHLEYTLAFRVL